MQELKQGAPERTHQDTAHSGFEKLVVPSALALVTAAMLAGCSVRHPVASAYFDIDVNVQPVTLVANDTARGAHFYFDSLSATFGKPGEYRIIDGIAGKNWSVTIGTNEVGKSIPLDYGKQIFWCQRDQGVYPITVMWAAGGGAPQTVTAYFSAQPVR